MAWNQFGSGPGEGNYNMPNDFSDDSSTTTTQDYGESQQQMEIRLWDTFRVFSPKPKSGSMASKKCFEVMLKAIKLFVYIFVFIGVLGGGVIAMSVILLMTSQIRENRIIFYCNNDMGTDKQFVLTLPEEIRIAWTWCIIFAFAVPEFFALLRSLRISIFKKYKAPPASHFLLIFLVETVHVIGLVILFLAILPELDVIKGAMMTNCVCFVPGLLGLLSRNKDRDGSGRQFLALIDIAALIIQGSGFFLWPLIDTSEPILWLIAPAMIMISCRWWENYVSTHSAIGIIRSLAKIKDEMKATRHLVYVFAALWKVVVFVGCTMIIHKVGGSGYSSIFTMFGSAFSDRNVTITELNYTIGGGTIPDFAEVLSSGETSLITIGYATPLWFLLIQLVAAIFVYSFGKFACQILIQGFSFAFPTNLIVAATISFLVAACGLRNSDPCYYHGIMPDYLSFDSPSMYSLRDVLSQQYPYIWLLWLVSQIWITLHIWTPKCERLASTKRLFVLPMYDALLIGQSMALNRRRDDDLYEAEEDDPEAEKEKNDTDSMYKRADELAVPTVRSSDYVTKIYICATMWHETKDEMVEFLKSVLRLDEDQCARRVTQKYLEVVLSDYYELETHVYFDDAFTCMHGCRPPCSHDDNESQVNEYVMLLVSTLEETIQRMHMRSTPPKKYPTPYGGRLVWTLPGKTKMIVHLKDKNKIRHRKRWSQVMYMYYLLGYRLMNLPIDVNRKEVIAENTYLLALDGDIDFQPTAVQVLIDLMKRNKNLGAACGRIHPIGSGPMVWYQMFEYAIGHWLQKATEHVIGCVLCSPGCFSLFRAKALMDDNVMRKYTTMSTEASHYVQFDQGEDRWLCTLLLQMGYRVEYSAASDSYTHAPESFNEFFNQRRRWIPSTIANIFDLLSTSTEIRKVNDNISLPYIMYQYGLMGSTILGPGTIFLILVGALNAVFSIAQWSSFLYNLVPITIFIIVCFTCKANIQLKVAAVISTIYAMEMIAVLVGILIQIAEDGLVAPSSLLFFVVAGQIVIAGLFHPQELICLVCGLVYYVTIPSMYLLLIIYSVFNLNNVTWGTRESKPAKSEEDAQKEQDTKESSGKGKQNPMLGFLRGKGTDQEKGSVDFSFAGLFRILCCTHGTPSDEKKLLSLIADSLGHIEKRLDTIETLPFRNSGKIVALVADLKPWNNNDNNNSTVELGPNFGRKRAPDPLGAIGEVDTEEDQRDSDTETTTTENTEPSRERNFLVSPYWLEDESVRKGEVDFLSTQEEQFWRDLIEKYLHPLEENPEQLRETAAALKDLRNAVVFKFLLLNSLFVLIVFLMQLNKDMLYIKWPLGINYNISYDTEAMEVLITSEYLQLEPIGMVFIIFFGLILFIQFIAMLFHRFDTLAHMLANTTFDWYCFKKPKDLSSEVNLEKQVVDFVREMQRVDDMDMDNGPTNAVAPSRRKTIQKLGANKQLRPTITTLEGAFRKRLNEVEGSGLPPILSARRSTKAFKAFEERRNTVMAERRKSQLQRLGANNVYGGASRRPTVLSQVSVMESFDTQLGHSNQAFQSDDSPSNGPIMAPRISQVTWRNNESKIYE